jgi:hypothetical protein
MAYHKHFWVTEPISGGKYDISVMSDAERVRDGVDFPADVYITVGGGVSVSLRMTPADAKALASHLALAAITAERGDPEIIDFTLDREAA